MLLKAKLLGRYPNSVSLTLRRHQNPASIWFHFHLPYFYCSSHSDGEWTQKLKKTPKHAIAFWHSNSPDTHSRSLCLPVAWVRLYAVRDLSLHKARATGKRGNEEPSNHRPAQSSCWSTATCLSQEACISCLEVAEMMMTSKPSLAYAGADASAQQR